MHHSIERLGQDTPLLRDYRVWHLILNKPDKEHVFFAAVAATLVNSPVQIPRQRDAALGRHAEKISSRGSGTSFNFEKYSNSNH